MAVSVPAVPVECRGVVRWGRPSRGGDVGCHVFLWRTYLVIKRYEGIGKDVRQRGPAAHADKVACYYNVRVYVGRWYCSGIIKSDGRVGADDDVVCVVTNAAALDLADKAVKNIQEEKRSGDTQDCPQDLRGERTNSPLRLETSGAPPHLTAFSRQPLYSIVPPFPNTPYWHVADQPSSPFPTLSYTCPKHDKTMVIQTDQSSSTCMVIDSRQSDRIEPFVIEMTCDKQRRGEGREGEGKRRSEDRRYEPDSET